MVQNYDIKMNIDVIFVGNIVFGHKWKISNE